MTKIHAHSTAPVGDPSYACSKLYEAVHALAVGPGDARSRVHDAYTTFIAALSPDDFPNDIKPLFLDLRKRLSAKPATKYEDSTAVTIKAMRNNKAVELAELILRLHSDLEDHLQI